MSITRLQQARQMYAMGQRVAKTLDGSRPGYRGSDYGDEARGTGAYGDSQDNPGDQNSFNTETGTTSNNTGSASNDDRSSALQTYNHNIATGQADKNPYGPVPLNKREQVLQNFYNTRPKVNFPNFGILGLVGNLAMKPIQKFSDFTTKKNRAFFENVIRAGKIPGLNFGTVAEMSPEQLENAYSSYMSNRMSGATDAYGNPIGDNEGIQGENINQGIAPLYNYNMFDDTEENANDPFVSRYLQNKPDDIRKEIESRIQNYYTV